MNLEFPAENEILVILVSMKMIFISSTLAPSLCQLTPEEKKFTEEFIKFYDYNVLSSFGNVNGEAP